VNRRFLLGSLVFNLVLHLPPAANAESTVFHYEMKAEPEGPQPLGFPLGLAGGEVRDAVTADLQARGLQRGSFDKDNTTWIAPKNFLYKSFHPYALALTYKNDRLMQLTLVQPDLPECQDIQAMVQDAVAYIQAHYTYPKENIQPAPHFGTNSCVSYMKPGQSGWLVWDKDYALSVDTSWKDGKEMTYSGYVAFTYLPLYNEAQKGK
jgi:hypothetical protein